MEQKQFYKRRIYIINKSFQFKYLFIILSVMLITVGTVYFTTFYVIWNNVINEFFFVPDAARKLGDIFVKTSELLVAPIAALAIIFSVAGILFSHKIAGPLYRVQKVAEEISKGNLCVKVKFRKGDEVHYLADSLNKMIDGIKDIVIEDKKVIDDLDGITEKLKNAAAGQRGLKKNVAAAIKKLNSTVKKLKKANDKFKV